MKNKGILKIGIIVCAIVLAVAVALGFTDTLGYHYPNEDRYTAGNTEISETVKNLDIEWINGKVNIAYHIENTVVLSETSDKPITEDMQLRWWLDGDTLRIRFAKPRFAFVLSWGQQKDLTVTLPEGIALAQVNIEATSGDLVIPAIQAEEVKLDTTSGDINATLTASDITVESTSGDVSLNLAGEPRDTSIRTTSGDVHITGNSMDRLFSHSTSGNVGVDVENLASSSIETTSGAIEVKTREFRHLSIKSTSGNVYAHLPTEPGWTAKVKTTSGVFNHDMYLRTNGDGYVCGVGSSNVTIETTSGNVQIDPVD
ncbi:MAG: DUF4097 family beta strand repeat protein [Clostridia bacterium]|nr:DUF4097 family beta strand repeat protein [Clostridia bacterium]